jgi:hypothetical protein
MKTRKKLVGILAIFAVPILYAVESLFLWIFYSYMFLFLFLIISVVTSMHFFWLFDIVSYDSQEIRQVKIPDVNDDIVNLLKTTTNRGDLINVHLIRTFENDGKYTRRELKDILEKKGITLTQPRINEYIEILEKYGVLSSPQLEPYNKPYALATEGKHYLWLVQTYFPKTRLLFLWRHYIGVKGKAKG